MCLHGRPMKLMEIIVVGRTVKSRCVHFSLYSNSSVISFHHAWPRACIAISPTGSYRRTRVGWNILLNTYKSRGMNNYLLLYAEQLFLLKYILPVRYAHHHTPCNHAFRYTLWLLDVHVLWVVIPFWLWVFYQLFKLPGTKIALNEYPALIHKICFV